ncbi:MAG: glycosyltransferase family 4 protein [bacterium]
MPIRITFVISSVALGGAEKILVHMANYWARKGMEISLLSFDDGKEPPFFPLDPSIDHHPLDLAGGSTNTIQAFIRNMKRIHRLRRAIRQTAPHAVISFMDQTNVLTLIATRGMGVPVIVSERTNPHSHAIGRAWEWLRLRVYPRADCVVVQTRQALEYFPASIRNKGRVIPNPVIDPCEEDAMAPPRPAKKLIVALGRLAHEKGFDMLLDAFRRIAVRHSGWSLLIIGEGPERGPLEALRDRYGLQERVHLFGSTTKPWAVIKEAALFVLSSRYEGFPNALCEAMACGLPVVSYDCPNGPREIIRDGVDGILVPPGDVSALASAMERLVFDEALRVSLGSKAREVCVRFGLEAVMARWEEVLRNKKM